MTARLLKLDASEVQLGMFIADLDRPWLDTPFLIQGFLLESEDDLATLRRLCAHVFVDRNRSTIDLWIPDAKRPSSSGDEATIHAADAQLPRVHTVVVQRPRPAAPGRQNPSSLVARNVLDAARRRRTNAGEERLAERAPPPPSAPTARIVGRADDAPPPPSDAEIARRLERERTSVALPGLFDGVGGSVSHLIERLSGWWSQDGGAAVQGSTFRDSGKSNSAHRDLPIHPPGMRVVVYAEPAPIERDLPRAREAYARTERALEQIVRDVQKGNHLETEKIGQVSSDLVDSVVANPDALMWVARLRGHDDSAYAHGLRVAVYLLSLGRQLGFPQTELRHLGTIGMLLDIGKLRTPRTLLVKKGKLTDEEFDEVKRHVEHGITMLSASGSLPAQVLEGIAQHHERMNGQGYPHGLEGKSIGVYGRMAGIVDCFAALISPRPYAEACSPSEALLRLYDWGGDHFHRPLVERLIHAIGVFPVGSLVELSSGEVGVVVQHNLLRRLQPRVLIMTGLDKQPLESPREFDLLQQRAEGDDRISIVRGLPAGAYGLDTGAYYATVSA